MEPLLIAGIVAFVIFDALVVVLVLSLADLRRHEQEAARLAASGSDPADIRRHNGEVATLRDLVGRFPWRWSAAIFRFKVPDEISASGAPAADAVAFDELLRQLLPRLGAPMLAFMLYSGRGSEADPRVVLRWAAGQEKPLGLIADRRLRAIQQAVGALSPHLSDRQIRRWFNQPNPSTHDEAPAEAIRRDYLDAVISAARTDAANQ